MEEGEAAADVRAESSGMLDHLKQEDASLLGLLRVLLSPRTLPHVAMLGLLALVLHLLAKNGAETMSAIGFLSMAGGYLFTGLLSHFDPVHRLTHLAEEPNPSGGRLKRLLLSFRICLLPLLFAGLVWALLLALIGENGALGNWTNTLPGVLAFGFIAWAVIQGRGFGMWLSALAATRLPDARERTSPTTRLSSTLSFAMLLGVTVLLFVLFEMMATGDASAQQALTKNFGFVLLFGAVFAISWRRARVPRNLASQSTELHAFSVRWMFLTQALITWHLLTVWRHWFISPGNALLLVEELVLLGFTVLMAIWGLTSRSFRSPLQLVNTTNALPMGLAFGYAYAGSVAMLTVVLEDVRNVMMAGHIVVALTFFWMQPKVLGSVLNQHDQLAAIRTIVDQATQAAESEEEAPVEEANENSIESYTSLERAEHSDSTSSFQGVEWKPPEVLATEVEWDDEVEMID